MSPPAVRALHLQRLDAALEALGAETAAAVRARLDPWTRRRIRDAGRLEWVAAEVLVELCSAAHDEVGPERLRGWGAAALEAVFSNPLAAAFHEAALRIAGRDPATILTYLVRAWPLLYRDCGDVQVTDVAPGQVRLVHAPVPPCLRGDATKLPLIGALGAIPAHCGLRGDAAAEAPPDSPRFVYVVRWDV